MASQAQLATGLAHFASPGCDYLPGARTVTNQLVGAEPDPERLLYRPYVEWQMVLGVSHAAEAMVPAGLFRIKAGGMCERHRCVTLN